jgi:acetylornithine deacetylase/succinyl-diaminopimelate desuccinylase-like protein
MIRGMTLGIGVLWSLIAAAQDWHEHARAMYAKAIETPTVIGRDRVPELAAYFAAEFRAAGYADSDIHVLPYDRTAAVIARWPAEHPTEKPILLFAHLDVVEARREDWSTDPFELVEKDGYFYGRGTLDDKSGVIGVTEALIRLKAERFKPDRDIVVLLTGDEETNGRGAILGATEWRKWTDAEFALNADAGGGTVNASGKVIAFSLQAAEKTYASFSFTARNRGGHSSQPRPDNAIYELAAALKRLEAHRFEPELNEATRGYFSARQNSESGPLGDAMRRWLANPSDRAAADVIEADPAEVGLTRTTCVATRLEAGHADNALPQTARAIVNCRIMPGIKIESIRAELVRAVADAGVEVALWQATGEAPASPLRPDVVEAYTAAVHRRFPGAPIIPDMSTGASDSVPFRAAGIPCYGVEGTWIVVPEDMRMHGRDERLPVKALYDNVDHWRDLIATLAGGRGEN